MTPEVKRAMNEKDRGTVTIDQIADQNKRVITPI